MDQKTLLDGLRVHLSGEVRLPYRHRRHWLLMTLLEDYFALRGLWYRGPKRSLNLLAEQSLDHFAVISQAWEPSASIADIRQAVAVVIGCSASSTAPTKDRNGVNG